MTNSDQLLASHVVRSCASCSTPTLLNTINGENANFRCTSCGQTIELWDYKSIFLTVLSSVAFLSWVILDDEHLFRALLHILANPLTELKAMLVDGVWAPVWIPLGLTVYSILTVGFPILALSYALQQLYIRYRNPVAAGVDADAALEGHEFTPEKETVSFSWTEFVKAAMIAVALQAAFIALAWAVLLYGNPGSLEDLMRRMLPGMLFGGGILFSVHRWMVAIVWLLLMPLSGFIIANLTGQLT